MKTISNQKCLTVDVILTFNKCGGQCNETQDFYEVDVPLNTMDSDAAKFLNEKFFPAIYDICVSNNRQPGELIKISTSANWKMYEKLTGGEKPMSFGHPCKWYFGTGRNDLDNWEKYLIKKYGFGLDADIFWLAG